MNQETSRLLEMRLVTILFHRIAESQESENVWWCPQLSISRVMSDPAFHTDRKVGAKWKPQQQVGSQGTVPVNVGLRGRPDQECFSVRQLTSDQKVWNTYLSALTVSG